MLACDQSQESTREAARGRRAVGGVGRPELGHGLGCGSILKARGLQRRGAQTWGREGPGRRINQDLFLMRETQLESVYGKEGGTRGGKEGGRTDLLRKQQAWQLLEQMVCPICMAPLLQSHDCPSTPIGQRPMRSWNGKLPPAGSQAFSHCDINQELLRRSRGQ